jgi:single-strand DNA-binding protein
MYSLNRIHLIGYLTEKPEVRQLSNGTSVADLNIKCVEKIKKSDGSSLVLSSYHTVTVWRRMAEIVGDYCQAGSQIFIAGRIKTDSWEADGQKRYKTKVIADDLILLDSRKEMAPLDEASPVFGGVNQVEVLGNLTREPELRQTTSGQNVANFAIATSRKWQDKNTGDMKEETEFHSVVAWGDIGKEATEKMKTGQKVYVRGRLQTRSWDTPDGEKRFITEIIADQVLSLGMKSQEFVGNVHPSLQKENISSESSSSPVVKSSSEEKEPELPTIKYESDIKPEDLPF